MFGYGHSANLSGDFNRAIVSAQEACHMSLCHIEQRRNEALRLLAHDLDVEIQKETDLLFCRAKRAHDEICVQTHKVLRLPRFVDNEDCSPLHILAHVSHDQKRYKHTMHVYETRETIALEFLTQQYRRKVKTLNEHAKSEKAFLLKTFQQEAQKVVEFATTLDRLNFNLTQ